MTSIASCALRTVGVRALALAAASPTPAFSPRLDPPGPDPQPDPSDIGPLGRSGVPAPHNPPIC